MSDDPIESGGGLLRHPFQGSTLAEDYLSRIQMLRQIAEDLDIEAEENGVKPPCSEASVIREAADEIEARRAQDHITAYVNLATVVVVLCPVRWRKQLGLIVVRRGIPGDTYGKLALPGGYQEGTKNHSIRFTAHKELREETGLNLNPEEFQVITAETDEYHNNVVFVEHWPVLELSDDHQFTHDKEVLQVGVVSFPIETCYPLHTKEIAAFFNRATISPHS